MNSQGPRLAAAAVAWWPSTWAIRSSPSGPRAGGASSSCCWRSTRPRTGLSSSGSWLPAASGKGCRGGGRCRRCLSFRRRLLRQCPFIMTVVQVAGQRVACPGPFRAFPRGRRRVEQGRAQAWVSFRLLLRVLLQDAVVGWLSPACCCLGDHVAACSPPSSPSPPSSSSTSPTSRTSSWPVTASSARRPGTLASTAGRPRSR